MGIRVIVCTSPLSLASVCVCATTYTYVCERSTLGGGRGHTIHRNFKEIEGHSMHTIGM